MRYANVTMAGAKVWSLAEEICQAGRVNHIATRAQAFSIIWTLIG